MLKNVSYEKDGIKFIESKNMWFTLFVMTLKWESYSEVRKLYPNISKLVRQYAGWTCLIPL